MALQLVYTSAAKLLDAGRSGFGTVARSKTLSPLVVSAVERVSQFANIRGMDRSRVIFSHRRIVAANNRVHLLSRIVDAGVDYTGRTNHIAHHLIVTQEEVARAAAVGVNPADVLMQFSWLPRWDSAPKAFGPESDVAVPSFQPLGSLSGRAEWQRVTGQPTSARLLAWESAPRSGVLILPPGGNPLNLLAEALHEMGAQSWSKTFTTHLEGTDDLSDFDWIVSTSEAFAEISSRCGSRTRLDLTQVASLPIPPEVAIKAPTLEAPSGHGADTAVIPAPSMGDAEIQKLSPVLNVNVAPGRKATTAASARPPASKSRFPVLAGIGLMVIIGIGAALFFMVSKPPRPASSVSTETPASNTKTHGKEEDLVRIREILKQEEIIDATIEEFIAGGTADKEAWAQHVGRLLSIIFRNDLQSRPPNIDPSPKGQTEEWIQDLKDAADQYFDLEKNREEKLSWGHRSPKIAFIRSKLKQASKKLSDEDKKHLLAFGDQLLRRELEGELAQKPPSAANFLTYLSHTTESENYKTLLSFIRDRFDVCIDAWDLSSWPGNLGALVDSSHEKYLKDAIACWQDPTEKPSEDLKHSYGSGFLPANFDELLQKRHATQNPEGGIPEAPLIVANDSVPNAPESAPPAPTKVPKRSVILFSDADWKSGKKVPFLDLLKPHLNGAKVDLKSKGITITLTEEDKGIEVGKLYQDLYDRSAYSPIENFAKRTGEVLFSPARITAEKAPRFIRLSDREHTCFIVSTVSDSRNAVAELGFDLQPINDNTVEFVGEIVEWVKNDKSLELFVNNKAVAGFRQTRPALVPQKCLPEDARSEINSDKYKKLSIRGATPLNASQQKPNQTEFNNLCDALEMQIGLVELRDELKLGADGDEEEKKKRVYAFMEKHKIKLSAASNSSFDVIKKEAAKKYGPKVFRSFLGGRADFWKKDGPLPGQTALDREIERLFKAPPTPQTLIQEMGNVTVEARSGTTLIFKGIRKK